MIIQGKTSQQPIEKFPVMKVMGFGGAGCNTIDHMLTFNIEHVEFIAANTDQQALSLNRASHTILLGPHSTKGLGAGGNPEIGKMAAEESFREISQAFEGADLVFLTAGMGGGTGTGAISVAARIAKSMDIIVIAFVTTPFSFEFGQRKRNADEGIAQLRPYTNTLVTIPNDKLLNIAPPDLPLDMAFRLSDEALRMGIQGISELISKPGLINVDAAHILRMLTKGGGTYIASGKGWGENRTMQALNKAINHPLFDAIPLEQASGVIVNIHASANLPFEELAYAMNFIKSNTNAECEIIPGVILDEKMGNDCEITLVVSGIGATSINDPNQAYLAQFASTKEQKEKKNPMHETTVTSVPDDEILNLPSYLRNRQIPIELIESDYGKTYLRTDL